jgi:hypothetical protein
MRNCKIPFCVARRRNQIWFTISDRNKGSSFRFISLAGESVENLMAFPTKCDEVGLSVIPKSATPNHVMNVEILRASTTLTAPTISLQNFPT